MFPARETVVHAGEFGSVYCPGQTLFLMLVGGSARMSGPTGEHIDAGCSVCSLAASPLPGEVGRDHLPRRVSVPAATHLRHASPVSNVRCHVRACDDAPAVRIAQRHPACGAERRRAGVSRETLAFWRRRGSLIRRQAARRGCRRCGACSLAELAHLELTSAPSAGVSRRLLAGVGAMRPREGSRGLLVETLLTAELFCPRYRRWTAAFRTVFHVERSILRGDDGAAGQLRAFPSDAYRDTTPSIGLPTEFRGGVVVGAEIGWFGRANTVTTTRTTWFHVKPRVCSGGRVAEGENRGCCGFRAYRGLHRWLSRNAPTPHVRVSRETSASEHAASSTATFKKHLHTLRQGFT